MLILSAFNAGIFSGLGKNRAEPAAWDFLPFSAAVSFVNGIFLHTLSHAAYPVNYGLKSVLLLLVLNRTKEQTLDMTNDNPTQNELLNTYHAFWRGKQIELKAATSFGAQQAAAQTFRAKKRYEVTIVLVAKAGGSEIVHVADF